MTLKHFPWVYYMNICHVEPPWGHSGTHGGPKMAQTALKWPRMAQNHNNGSKWDCMTPNDPKTLQMGILHDYMSCWTNLGPFQRPSGAQKLPKTSPRWPKISPKWLSMTTNVLTWPQMAQKTLPMGILHDVVSCWSTLGPFQRPMGPQNGPNSTIMALHDQKWPFMTQNGPAMKKLHDPKYPIMTQNVPAWPKMVLQWRNFMTQNISSWPKMSLHDPKWPLNIS